MLDWLVENARLVSALTNVLLLGVWVVYTGLFYGEFKRQRRPFLFVHQGGGPGPDALCLVVNLSGEPVHVLCVLAVSRSGGRQVVRRVDAAERSGGREGSHTGTEDALRQGPLRQGGFLEAGRFEGLWAGDASDGELELRVVAMHGSDQRPVGARRTFVVAHRDGRPVFRSGRALTEQLTGRRDRREVGRWLEQCLREAATGAPRG